MENYQILEKMARFILSSDIPVPYRQIALIDYGRIIQGDGSDGELIEIKDGEPFPANGGISLSFIGDNVMSRNFNAWDELVSETMLTNFILRLWRVNNENSSILDVQQANKRLLDWFNRQNALRLSPQKNPLIPILGDNPYTEVLTAQGGGQTLVLTDNRAEYTIQIGCKYDRNYV